MVDIDFTLQIASKKKSNGFKSEEIGGHLTSLLGYCASRTFSTVAGGEGQSVRGCPGPIGFTINLSSQ